MSEELICGEVQTSPMPVEKYKIRLVSMTPQQRNYKIHAIKLQIKRAKDFFSPESRLFEVDTDRPDSEDRYLSLEEKKELLKINLSRLNQKLELLKPNHIYCNECKRLRSPEHFPTARKLCDDCRMAESLRRARRENDRMKKRENQRILKQPKLSKKRYILKPLKKFYIPNFPKKRQYTPKPLIEKICAFSECDNKFMTNIPHHVYCCHKCKEKNRNQKKRRYPQKGKCANCGVEIIKLRPTKRFCGKKCGSEYREKKVKGVLQN